MDPLDSDWIFIPVDATPKKKSSPKPVPAVASKQATSFDHVLKKGGKPPPVFARPASLLQPSVPRVTQPGPQQDFDDSVQDASRKRKPSVFKPISAPTSSKTPKPAVRPEVIPPDLVARWMILVNSVGALSAVWSEYHMSAQFESHCHRLLTRYAPSTLFKYINTLQCIYTILLDFAWTWKDIGSHRLSDLLQIAHEGKHSEWGFGATTAIKALRWAQKLLLIHTWQMLYDPVVNSFCIPGNHERRESIPLSLFLVVQWERRILMHDCPPQEQIILGGLLCLLWAGLRFADGQRIQLNSLSWCITALRGSCFRTKTSRAGQPWAIQARGFLSHGDWSWVAQWLTALDCLWGSAPNAVSDGDFLLPMTKGSTFAYPLIPMSYSQALHWLRYFCTLPWKHSPVPASANPNDYTLHSLKTTTLSWSNQLAQKGLVTEEQRHLQGHHRRGSMRLYSRDDTAGQLALQNTLILQVQSGHRFVTPLHRGSQQPIQEPLVLLDKFSKPYPMRRWTFFPFDNATKDPVLQGIPTQEDSNLVDLEKDQVSDSSDSSSSSTSSDASASVVYDADVGPVDELIVARFTKVQHIMIETDDSLCPFWESRYFKAACGARLPRDDCVFDVQLRPQFSMCRHVACFKRWQQITALAD